MSDGGLLVALAEMAMAGKLGAGITDPRRRRRRTPSCSARTRRAIVWPPPSPTPFSRPRQAAGVPALRLGAAGGDALTLAGRQCHIDCRACMRLNEAWLPAYMAGKP